MQAEKILSQARTAIENQDMICYDVAATHGQMFSNVRHTSWFAQAVADAITEQHDAELASSFGVEVWMVPDDSH